MKSAKLRRRQASASNATPIASPTTRATLLGAPAWTSSPYGLKLS